MDKLDDIFAKQRQLDDFLISERGLDFDTQVWVQKGVLAMISELAELLDEVNFKWWKNPTPVNEDRVKDEMVDILHFFVSMCNKIGMDSQELYERYLAKNEVNFRRQHGTGDKPGYELPAGPNKNVQP